jgi:hypothetical protein
MECKAVRDKQWHIFFGMPNVSIHGIELLVTQTVCDYYVACSTDRLPELGKNAEMDSRPGKTRWDVIGTQTIPSTPNAQNISRFSRERL